MIFIGAFREGDRVNIGDVTGDVLETTLLVAGLRIVKNEVVTIYNGQLMGNRIVNYSAQARQDRVILHTSLTIGHDAPWRRVRKLLIEAARATEGSHPQPGPFVLQTSLGDFRVSYEIDARARSAASIPRIYNRLHQHIQHAFSAGGVEILSPHYTPLRDGSPTTISAGNQPPEEERRRFEIDVRSSRSACSPEGGSSSRGRSRAVRPSDPE